MEPLPIPLFQTKVCGMTGKTRVSDVAELEYIIVHTKTIKILGHYCAFKFHINDTRNLPPILEEPEVPGKINKLSEAIYTLSTHSISSPRPRPSTTVHSDYIDCSMRGSDRVRV